MKPFILRRLGKRRQTHLSGCKPARGLTVANAFIIQQKGEVISAGVGNEKGCGVEGGGAGTEGRGMRGARAPPQSWPAVGEQLLICMHLFQGPESKHRNKS